MNLEEPLHELFSLVKDRKSVPQNLGEECVWFERRKVVSDDYGLIESVNQLIVGVVLDVLVEHAALSIDCVLPVI